MKLIIAGGRDYIFTGDDYAWLSAIPDVTEVVSGGAPGADNCGEIWAARNGVPVVVFNADWSQGKKAGPLRNIKMAEYADALAIFPGGRGSAHMKSVALKVGLRVYERTGE